MPCHTSAFLKISSARFRPTAPRPATRAKRGRVWRSLKRFTSQRRAGCSRNPKTEQEKLEKREHQELLSFLSFLVSPVYVLPTSQTTSLDTSATATGRAGRCIRGCRRFPAASPSLE